MKRLVPALLLVTALAHADEGMWTLDNFPSERVRAKYGVDIDQAWLDRVRLATARLEGGCTGSFVSPNGLVLTNRHCVWDCLTQHNTAGNNIWDHGFVARHPGEELRCNAEQVSVLVGTQEITEQVTAAVSGLDEAAALDARNRLLTRLESECETAAEDRLSCEAVTLYNGGQYFIYRYRRYEDVRLVMAPGDGIAAFGGDPDNFNFPRWNLDMAFLRVYEEGRAAGTPVFLPWRAEGPDAGEPVFVSGHPGATERQLTVGELEFLREVTLPHWLLRYSELRGRYIQFSKEDEEAFRIIQHPLTRIENAIKVRRNELTALLDDRMMGRRRAEQLALRDAVAADPDLAGAVGPAWAAIEVAQQVYLGFRDHYIFNEGKAGFQGDLFNYARTLVRAASERAKPNEDRLREYTEAALPQLRQFLLAPTPVQPRLERLELSYGFDKMREFLGPDDPFVRMVLGNESPDSLAATLVEGTRLGDPDYRRRLWEGGLEAIRASKDPMLRLARAVDDAARALRKRYEDEVEAPIASAHEAIARARFAIHGTGTYPDATFTLRVSYGAVEGWQEHGRRIPPFTHLDRLYQRATGEFPFALPKAWMEAKPRLDMDTPVNFSASLDIAGGNSGSPVIDARGRLVGVAFDGNTHSIAGAYWYDPALNRAVAVHPAFMLEALEVVYDARHIVGELTGGSE